MKIERFREGKTRISRIQVLTIFHDAPHQNRAHDLLQLREWLDQKLAMILMSMVNLREKIMANNQWDPKNKWDLRHTNYFNKLIAEGSVPMISSEQHLRMNRIMAVEAILKGLRLARERIKNTDFPYRLHNDIIEFDNELKDLTKRKDPHNLVMDMVRASLA